MKVSTYLSETVLWGGLQSTRGTIITEMLKDGFSRREIDYYLMGLDSGIDRRRKTSASNVLT